VLSQILLSESTCTELFCCRSDRRLVNQVKTRRLPFHPLHLDYRCRSERIWTDDTYQWMELDWLLWSNSRKW